MTVQAKLTCKDKVKDSFQNLLDEWIFDVPDDSLYDYVNQTALSWDFVEANSFKETKTRLSVKLSKSKAYHMEAGYYRLQLSYGGPSTEFRVYTDKDLNIDRIESWYLAWFDVAFVVVDSSNSIVVDLIQQFLELERND